MTPNHCLIVSPIPSHPQFQGNSARIYRFGRSLQAMGYQVHFLYYPLEGLTQAQRDDMSVGWDHFYTLPCDLPSGGKMSRGDHYGIDDWYDPRVGELAAKLHRRWQYKFVLVNYVWFSGVLDALPNNVTKIIDTHDVFGDRHIRSIQAGMKPEWFYTTVAEEKRGLERADIVVAIQDEEQRYFESQGLPRVETVGFITPRRRVASLPRERLAIGYLASGNPWNINGLNKLIDEMSNYPALAEHAGFLLAGPICDKMHGRLGPFRPLGIVDRVDDFYARIDIALNPMLGGTGLKIKTVEALSFGCGVVSTEDGFVGIESLYPEHQFQNMADFAEHLSRTVNSDIESVDESQRKSDEVFSTYQQRQIRTLSNLFQRRQQAA